MNQRSKTILKNVGRMGLVGFLTLTTCGYFAVGYIATSIAVQSTVTATGVLGILYDKANNVKVDGTQKYVKNKITKYQEKIEDLEQKIA